MEFEDLKIIGTVIGVALLFIGLIVVIVMIPVYAGEYWSCTNLSNLYGGEYDLKFIFPNGCLIKTNGFWVSYREFQNYLNLNIVK